MKGFVSGSHFGLVDEEYPSDVLPWLLYIRCCKESVFCTYLYSRRRLQEFCTKHLGLGYSPAVADSHSRSYTQGVVLFHPVEQAA